YLFWPGGRAGIEHRARVPGATFRNLYRALRPPTRSVTGCGSSPGPGGSARGHGVSRGTLRPGSRTNGRGNVRPMGPQAAGNDVALSQPRAFVVPADRFAADY